MALSRPTGILTLGVLGGSFISKILQGNNHETDKLKNIHNLEVAILGIAAGQYIITLPMNLQRTQRWRYFDWAITTPMLLKTFHLLAEEKGYEGSFNLALGADLAMILSGYFAEFEKTSPIKHPQSSTIWYVIGLVSLFIVLREVTKWHDFLKSKGVNTDGLVKFFYIGWVLYGVNFINPNQELRQAGFNILDLFNKGIYSYELDNVITKYF